MEINKIYNQDCLLGMKNIASESVDVILTDPPYKYLKNQKLEVDFDETIFFNEAKRILKKDGLIVLFGRGTSFYRWNTMLADMGFNFKEEIIWDKSYTSSPVHVLNRVHETVSIHTKLSGTLNSVKIPYLEQKSENIEGIISDIKRIKSALNNEISFDSIIDYLKTGLRNDFKTKRTSNFNTSLQTKALGRQEVNTMMAIKEGMKEKSIIKALREHYKLIHPTQKPVRLLERLLALVSKEGDLILDPFSGSGSTACACINANRNFIGFEIDEEYYLASKERIDSILKTNSQSLFNAHN
jgi:site-specific DNA-methyltransferase (adenine-specific)